MLDASWALFAAASLLLICTPGQDMALVMTRSVAQGVAAGGTVLVALGVRLALSSRD